MGIRLSDLGLRQKPSDITRLMSIALERPDMLSLAAGFTDTDSLPLQDVREIVEELSEDEREGKLSLQYGANNGRLVLRSMLAERVACQEGLERNAFDSNKLFVSNGSQQALYLGVQTLCNPGDCILVEQPTYFVFLEILSGLGVTPIPMPMDSRGEVDVDGLAALLDAWRAEGRLDRIKALYLVSYFANPTGHSISESVKSRIGELLSRQETTIAVIEDAAYRELYYEAPCQARSCLALESFATLPVLYSSTLTKPYASGLKVGYAYCEDAEWLSSMLAVKGQQDFGTAHFTQAIVERALKEGRFDDHLLSLRGIYREKMEALHGALREPLGALGWEWGVPQGGLYLWVRSPEGMRTDGASDFHAKCIEEGVFYVPGDLCYPANAIQDRIRLSFGTLALPDIQQAAERFVRAASTMTEAARF